MKRLLAHEKVQDIDALRLVLLYALRYEKHSNSELMALVEILKKRKLSEKQIRVNNNDF